MLIHAVIKNEEERNKRMIIEYTRLLSELPKGVLICRKNYFYLKFRENGKICDKYIGKESAAVEEIRTKLLLRKHYATMLEALMQEQKAIQKLLEDI